MRFRVAVGLAAFVAAGALLPFASPAQADLLITVDKTTQRMVVEKDGAELFVWPVSTGAAGYDTPAGTFTPFRLEKDHFSKEWDDAPMPHAIFFTKRGHAIHGSTHKSIGRPASHGCVRLAPKNAALLFDLVKQEGLNKTRVVLSGEAPGVTAPAVARRAPPVAPDVGFARGFATDDETVGALPPPDRGGRRIIGYRDAEGRVHLYDQPRAYAPPPRRYGRGYVQGYDERYGYEVPPPAQERGFFYR